MVKVCTFLAGNTLICHEQFMQCVSKKGVKIKEESMEKCDFILAFCPVSSRAGTDIAEALRRIEAQDKTDKAIILVVMHHTLNPNYVVHDSSEHLTRQHALALIVECLFHETKGLLRCSLNDKAVGHVRRQLKKTATYRQEMVLQIPRHKSQKDNGMCKRTEEGEDFNRGFQTS